MKTEDLHYFAGRAAQEREMADSAADETARRIHLQFAKAYEQIVRQNRPKNKLHIVSGP